MRKPALIWGVFGLLAAAIALGVICQERIARRLRAELAALQRQQADLASLRRENRALTAKQISVAELDRLHREHAEMERLRAKIEGLKSHPAAESVAAAGDNQAMVPASDWEFAGRKTPRAAFESVLWAATHQDIDRLATLLSFDPKTRAAADGFFAQLPEAVQAQYGSPEKIAATMLGGTIPANLSAMGELAESATPNDATLIMGVQRSDGSQKDTSFRFHRGTDGWQLIVPAEVMAGYGRKLGVPGAVSAGAQ